MVAAVAVGAGWWVWGREGTQAAERPDIPFAPLVDESLKDPDNPTKVFRVDFARLEHEFPLPRADLLELTPTNFRALSQEEIDQIYGRLTAGPIPDGPYQGDLFFARGDSLRPRLQEILGGIRGRLAGEKIELVERLGRTLWKGKLFDRDQMVLRNFIEDVKPIEGLIDHPDSLMTAEVPRGGLLGRILPTTSVWLLFPAKLYCGQSLLDGRRESVIVDYFSPTRSRATGRARTVSPGEAGCASAMRSGWSGPASILGAPTPIAPSCSTSRSTTPRSPKPGTMPSQRASPSRRTAGPASRSANRGFSRLRSSECATRSQAGRTLPPLLRPSVSGSA